MDAPLRVAGLLLLLMLLLLLRVRHLAAGRAGLRGGTWQGGRFIARALLREEWQVCGGKILLRVA